MLPNLFSAMPAALNKPNSELPLVAHTDIVCIPCPSFGWQFQRRCAAVAFGNLQPLCFSEDQAAAVVMLQIHRPPTSSLSSSFPFGAPVSKAPGFPILWD